MDKIYRKAVTTIIEDKCIYTMEEDQDLLDHRSIMNVPDAPDEIYMLYTVKFPEYRLGDIITIKDSLVIFEDHKRFEHDPIRQLQAILGVDKKHWGGFTCIQA